MLEDIYKHIIRLVAHLSLKVIESENIKSMCTSPQDLAVICHTKKYTNCEPIGMLLYHLAYFDYFEKRGGVYTLNENWQQVLYNKSESSRFLTEQGLYPLYLLHEHLAKDFLAIIRNESNLINPRELIYYFDVIDCSKGMEQIRSEAISQLTNIADFERIFDFSLTLGYSSIQLANLFPESEIYSLQLNPVFQPAYDYTMRRFHKDNIKFSQSYPSKVLEEVMEEKVDLITFFNPFGFEFYNFERYLSLAEQFSREGTQFLLLSPFTNEINTALLAEWLAFTIKNIGEYPSYDLLKIEMNDFNFQVSERKNSSNIIHAQFIKELD
ncbi:MAG: hypothetical protein U9O98_10405 [Asgard group archaeon]|nr:hypothetical protein [Asgard group archaeon]